MIFIYLLLQFTCFLQLKSFNFKIKNFINLPKNLFRRVQNLKFRKWENYYDGFTGYGSDSYQKVVNDKKGYFSFGSQETYGEILPLGIAKLINKIKTTSNDIMYDLGSGIGKVPTQFAFETQTKKCVGIELGQRRHNHAIEVLNKMKLDPLLNDMCNKIEFISGDILEIDWNDATILFINALCFPPDLWSKIEEKIFQNCKNLRYLCLVGPSFLGNYNVTIDNENTVYCEVSWDESSTCPITIYELNHIQ